MGLVPTVGEVVHYVLEDGYPKDVCRPALIVQVWGNSPESVVNLTVFPDWSNDTFKPDGSPENASGLRWKTSRVHSTERASYTWHRLNECAVGAVPLVGGSGQSGG